MSNTQTFLEPDPKFRNFSLEGFDLLLIKLSEMNRTPNSLISSWGFLSESGRQERIRILEGMLKYLQDTWVNKKLGIFQTPSSCQIFFLILPGRLTRTFFVSVVSVLLFSAVASRNMTVFWFTIVCITLLLPFYYFKIESLSIPKPFVEETNTEDPLSNNGNN